MPETEERKVQHYQLMIDPLSPPENPDQAELLRQFFQAEEKKQKKDPTKQKVFFQNTPYEFKYGDDIYHIQFTLPLVRREKYESIVTYESEEDLPEEKTKDENTLYVVNRKDGSGADIYSTEDEPRFLSKEDLNTLNQSTCSIDLMPEVPLEEIRERSRHFSTLNKLFIYKYKDNKGKDRLFYRTSEDNFFHLTGETIPSDMLNALARDMNGLTAPKKYVNQTICQAVLTQTGNRRHTHSLPDITFTPGHPIRDTKQISAVMRQCEGPEDRYIYDTFDPKTVLGEGGFGSVHDVPGRLIYSGEESRMIYRTYTTPMVVKHSMIPDDKEDYDFRMTTPKLERATWIELDETARENREDDLLSETKKPTSKKDPTRDISRPVTDVYMVQAKFPGTTLNSLIRSNRKLSFDERYELTQQLLSALQRFHRSFVHRDIKPDNIMVYETIDDTGKNHFRVKIIDVGFCKKAGGRATVKGTTKYIPPEIVLGEEKHITEQHDIYAMGIVLRKLWDDAAYAKKNKYFTPNEMEEYSTAEYHLDFPMTAELPTEFMSAHPDESQKIETLLVQMTMPRPEKRLSTVAEAVSILSPGIVEAKEQEEFKTEIGENEDIKKAIHGLSRHNQTFLQLALLEERRFSDLSSLSLPLSKEKMLIALLKNLFNKFIQEGYGTDRDLKEYWSYEKKKFDVRGGLGLLIEHLESNHNLASRDFIQYMALIEQAISAKRIPEENMDTILSYVSDVLHKKIENHDHSQSELLKPLLNSTYWTTLKNAWYETYLPNKTALQREKIGFAEYFLGFPARSHLGAKLVYFLLPPLLFPLFSMAKNTVKLVEFGLKAANVSFKDASYRLEQTIPLSYARVALSVTCDILRFITYGLHLLVRTTTSPITSFQAANTIENKWERRFMKGVSVVLSLATLGSLCYFAAPALIAAVPALTTVASYVGYPAIVAFGKGSAGFGSVILCALATAISEMRTSIVERLVNKNEVTKVHVESPKLSTLSPETHSPNTRTSRNTILSRLQQSVSELVKKPAPEHKQNTRKIEQVPTLSPIAEVSAEEKTSPEKSKEASKENTPTPHPPRSSQGPS